jgi:hypothetical protein
MNPMTNEHIMVPAKDEELPPISYVELKKIRKKLSTDPSEHIEAQEVLRAISEGLHREENKQSRTPYQAARAKAASKQADNEIIARSKQRPVINEASDSPAAKASIPLTRPSTLPELKPKKPQ